MKYNFFILFFITLFTACFSFNNNNITSDVETINYRKEMRNFVITISNAGRSKRSDFIIIPQNGIELVTDKNGSTIQSSYLNAINGHGQEDLFYGYDDDDTLTSTNDTDYLKSYLDISLTDGNVILVTDYCSTQKKIDNSYEQNNNNGYISFAAPDRDLNVIPVYPKPIYNENSDDINQLSDISNFLYIINPENYSDKDDFINELADTNYDLIIIDLFFNDNTELSNNDINKLKNKANGGKRLVICYMSIGEAEDYRYYWNSDWNSNKPSWLSDENPNWKGNYKVKYWKKEWQDIIYGDNNSYLNKILDAGFDGVYLDIIDAFEYFEE